MIACDQEYSITRYWRNVFQAASKEQQDESGVEPVIYGAIIQSYHSMVEELDGQLKEYLDRTGKQDTDFPEWNP